MAYQASGKGRVTSRTPGKAESLNKAMQTAYRALSIRPRSEEELKEKLRQKGFSDSLVEQAVKVLREKGYLNDGEFSQNFARYLLRRRNYGLLRIGEELRQKKIPVEIIQDTINSLKDEIDEDSMIINAIEKRLGESKYAQMDEKGKRRIIQHLSRKGFHINAIYEALKKRKWEVFEDERE